MLTYNFNLNEKGRCSFCGNKGPLFKYSGIDLKTRKSFSLTSTKSCYNCSLMFTNQFLEKLKGDVLTLFDDASGDSYFFNLKEKPMRKHWIND